MKMMIRTLWLAACLGLAGNISFAANNIVMEELETVTYQVPLNKSKLIRFAKPFRKISQSNPKIASFKLFPPREMLFQGKSLGTTNVYVWGRNNQLMQVINIEVTHDLETLKMKLHELLPGEQIEVRSSQRNIVLSGQVSGLDKMQAAMDIAQTFMPQRNRGQGSSNSGVSGGSSGSSRSRRGVNSVINLMSVSGAHQVMLEVKVAEINRDVAKGLNVQFSALRPSSEIAFGALNGGGTLSPGLGPIGTLLSPNNHSIDAAGIFLSALSGDFVFNMTLDAAKNQNLAKILAEPTLTTLSGQEAKFIAGGEFPIPVLQSSNNSVGSITVTFKEFGVGVSFLPVVLDSGRINLSMSVSVSEINNVASIANVSTGTGTPFTIPGLSKREASSTLELADGQTMSIAGLISDNIKENVNKFPGLGDIPVLGALFRNESFLKNKTELVIFVTPRLAKPVLADQIVLPTDSFIEPDDIDFYILGKLESNHAADVLRQKKSPSGGLDGQFGHELNEVSE